MNFLNLSRRAALRSLATLCALSLAALAGLGSIQAADADGTWTWSSPGRNGGPDRKFTLKLKVEGDKVTGTVASPNRDGQVTETKIDEGKLADGQVCFKVTREFNGNKFTAAYCGKVTGDSLKGKIETERDGQKNSRDWEAKRDVEKK